MSSITTLGLGATTTGNLAPYYTLFHFIFAYVALSSRPAKGRFRIDHNLNPRSDTVRHGPRAVADGKITQRQLDFLERNEACHANSMEHFPVFASAAVFATIAGVNVDTINTACAAYTAARVIYAAAYLTVEKSRRLALIRSLAWWMSNFACIRLFWVAGKAMNTAVA